MWIAARVLGREMPKITKRNEELHKRIHSFWEQNTGNGQSSILAEIIVVYFENTIEENKLVLEHIKSGFAE